MASPFPGMDLFIEERSIWTDFHSDLSSEIRASLNNSIRPKYYAALAPYVTYEVVEVSKSTPFGIRPDVAVFSSGPQLGSQTTAVVDQPQATSRTELEFELEIMGVEIRLSGTDRLVTAIEILSPVNKNRKHEARAEYLRKRRRLLRTETHFIEIDLLRAGERTPLDPPVPIAPYYVSLSRIDARPRLDVWTIFLDARLPRIPIPLEDGDPDAQLDLGSVVASVYERGGYDARIDYRKPVPNPDLTSSESAYVQKLLEARSASSV